MQCLHSLTKADNFPVQVVADNLLVNSNNLLFLRIQWHWGMKVKLPFFVFILFFCILVTVNKNIQQRDQMFTTVFSPHVIPGNYPLHDFPDLCPGCACRWKHHFSNNRLFSCRGAAQGNPLGPGLSIVLDRAPWLKTRKSPMGFPLIYNTHCFLNVVIRAQFCGAGWMPVSCSFGSVA